MSLAAARKRARRRNEHNELSELSESTHRERVRFLAASRRSDDTALLVPVAFLLAPVGRAGLLANDADDHVGFHPILRDAERELLRSRGRNADRCGAAVGHSISRPARFLHIVPRRNVVAQHRQSDDEPAAAVRIHYLAHDHEHRSALARRNTGDRVGTALLRLQPIRLGFALAAFLINLMLTSWAVGIFVSGLVIRNGLGAENFAWSIMFVFMPLACVYYPVTTLPVWLQPAAWVLPPTYVFEGMRSLLIQHVFRPDLMIDALALNAAMFAAAVFAFLKLLQSARRHGSLMQTGE